MTPDDRVARAQRWQAFYDEPMGLSYMFQAMTASIMQEATKAEPWETDRMKKATLALNILGELHQMVKAVIQDGQIAAHTIEHANRIANIPEYKRRWL